MTPRADRGVHPAPARLGVRRSRRPHDRQRTARALHSLATRGSALGFFPEGTFDKAPGLKAFQLGAFSAAARANLPVVPVVIHGARCEAAVRSGCCRARAAARAHLRCRARRPARDSYRARR